MIFSETIVVSSSAFKEGGVIPIEYTGFGKDYSPDLNFENLSDKARSIAIIMDDINHQFFGIFNHWTIWNLPVKATIPAQIPHGRRVAELGGAVQGIGYGRHRYRGPKPPFGSTHHYRFQVYILDTVLDLNASAKKRNLLAVMEGHVLQRGNLTGQFR